MKPTSEAKLKAAVSALEEHGTQALAARSMGVAANTFHYYIRRAREKGLYKDKPDEYEVKSERDPLPEVESIDEILEYKKKRLARLRARDEAISRIPIRVKRRGVVGLLIFGDPHLDDDHCHIHEVERDLALVRENDAIYGCCPGDFTNNWPSIGRLAKKWRDQTTTSEQARLLVEWFLKLGDPSYKQRGDWLIVLNGNHEHMSSKGDAVAWIANSCGILHQDWQAKLELQFPRGESMKMMMAHSFRGTSMYNQTHGMVRAKREMGAHSDELLVQGHHHTSGYHVEKYHGEFVSHLIKVGSYKVGDDYGKRFPDGQISPSVLVAIDPEADPRGRIHVFHDTEQGAEYVRWCRSR